MIRPAGISKRIVDPLNSVAWFAMDGLWLTQLAWPAYAATALTLVTGAILLFLDRKRGNRLKDDLALNAWMWMNAMWVISDLGEMPRMRYAAMGIGVLGAILLANAVMPTNGPRGVVRRLKKMRATGR